VNLPPIRSPRYIVLFVMIIIAPPQWGGIPIFDEETVFRRREVVGRGVGDRVAPVAGE